MPCASVTLWFIHIVLVISRCRESRKNERQPLYSEHNIEQVGATSSLEFDYNIAAVLSGFVDIDTVYCYFNIKYLLFVYLLGRVDSCRARGTTTRSVSAFANFSSIRCLSGVL